MVNLLIYKIKKFLGRIYSGDFKNSDIFLETCLIYHLISIKVSFYIFSKKKKMLLN